jgi:hypothetical protein
LALLDLAQTPVLLLAPVGRQVLEHAGVHLCVQLIDVHRLDARQRYHPTCLGSRKLRPPLRDALTEPLTEPASQGALRGKPEQYESLSEPIRNMLDGLTAIHDSSKAHPATSFSTPSRSRQYSFHIPRAH